MNRKTVASIAAASILAGAMSLTVLSGCGGESSAPANTVNSADDLVGKSIGVQLGTTGAVVAEDVEGATVEKYNKGVDAVQALKQGKIDAVIIDQEPAKVFVEKNSDLKIVEEDYAVEDYAIAVAKGNEALRDEINGALKTLKDNGTLDQISKNWIGDEAGSTPYESPADAKHDKGKLVMATNAEFPPYESMEGDKVVGYDADMMQAVCDTLGYELSIENMAFDSVITAVQSGKADVGVAGLSVTPDREKNVLFTDSYATSHQVIIVRNS
ncbi:MAG: transporter substrate-binding domain-containing protein [Oscillospiraceae bacterium]|nr:transporter substrate-binding domain-containing protein [Oscillospiraceae bacterium]